MLYGYHCSHEQHSPSALLRYAQLANAAGFEALMCSDHFKPWTTRQRHSGAAWSWLPAALQATTASFGTVNAPGQRYHPALIAQAAATIADLFPGRFWLAVGTGEALNESITGDEWPPKPVRRTRLEEAVSMMRDLWAGGVVENTDLVPTRDARLYSPPARPPLIFGAALTVDTARWAAGWADGLITVPGPRHVMRAIVDAFRERAGAARPIYLQVPLSFAPTDAEARAAAHDQWRQVVLSPEQLADLRAPEEFDAATASVTADDVAANMRISADLQRHVAWLQEDAELGYERIYLHNVAMAHQERFIEQMASALLPPR